MKSFRKKLGLHNFFFRHLNLFAMTFFARSLTLIIIENRTEIYNNIGDLRISKYTHNFIIQYLEFLK
jgi:hypothetical protein